MPSTTLFIPTWNGMPELVDVLRAVDEQPGASELERYAIDSGSTDDTVTCLRDHGFRVDAIPQAEFNHGTTRDLGIQRTEGEIICLLTQGLDPSRPTLAGDPGRQLRRPAGRRRLLSPTPASRLQPVHRPPTARMDGG